MPGLDGLRGVAVALVIAYHLPLTVAVVPGGTLGVDIFFVLSGFLVTSLLLEPLAARRSTGQIWEQLKGFWLRRAVRLVPALLVLLIGWALVWAITGGGGIFNTAVGHPPGASPVPVRVNVRGLLAVLFYSYNWLAASGTPLPLAFGHLWSLSVEEQFYLVWPVLLVLLLRIGRSRLLLAASVGLIVGSIMLAASHSAARGYAWSYFGTDSSAQQLVLGSVVAVCWSNGVLRLPRWATKVCGLAGIAVLAIAVRQLNGHSWLAAHGGSSAVALGAAGVVLAVVSDVGGPVRWLECRPLLWLGRRSYAVYLWSFPITMWSARMGQWPQAILVILLSLSIGELSWRLVEQPVQRHLRPRLSRYDHESSCRTMTVVTASPFSTETDPSLGAR